MGKKRKNCRYFLYGIALIFLVIHCGGKEGSVTGQRGESPSRELAAIWNTPEELFKKAEADYAASNYQEALTALDRITHGFPKSDFYAKALKLTEDVRNRLGAGQTKVGVILPLTGQFARFGESVLDGASCAFGLFDPCSDSSAKVQMLVRDSGGSPGMAASAVRSLALEEKVVGIVGPLVSGEMEAAAAEAERLQVPMILLAPGKRNGQHQFVFQHSLLPEREVQSLVQKATESGVQKFIILYPRNRYGESYKELFTKGIQQSGSGEMITTFGYAPDLPDFVGTLQLFFQRPNIAKAIQREGNHLGIFIPDSHRQIALIASALDHLKVTGPRLIGTSRWYHNSLLHQSYQSLEGAIIGTPFFAESGRGSTKKFTKAFIQAHGNEPAWLEAIGYDAAKMLLNAVTATGNNLATEVRNELARMNNFPGVVGPLSWDADGTSRWPLSFITIHDGEFRDL